MLMEGLSDLPAHLSRFFQFHVSVIIVFFCWALLHWSFCKEPVYCERGWDPLIKRAA